MLETRVDTNSRSEHNHARCSIRIHNIKYERALLHPQGVLVPARSPRPPWSMYALPPPASILLPAATTFAAEDSDLYTFATRNFMQRRQDWEEAVSPSAPTACTFTFMSWPAKVLLYILPA
jgi:hypothetical protein